MFVIVKRKLAFRTPAGDKGGKFLVLNPSKDPQSAPDWVGKAPEFEIASSDDSIMEVVLRKTVSSKYISKDRDKEAKRSDVKASSLGLEGGEAAEKDAEPAK